MVKKSSLFIGTSGWSYDWQEFYNEKVSSKDELSFLARHFGTVEVNYSFYRLPEIKTLEKWKSATPEEFVFSLKLSRYITHVKRLKKVKTPLKKFLRRYKRLEKKAGPILVQLPPNYKKDYETLKSFLEDMDSARKSLEMKRKLPLAVELRHASWFEDENKTERILNKAKAVWVRAHSSEYPYPEKEIPKTSPFTYFRLHGPKELFASRYGRSRLREWKKKIDDALRKGDVYVYFNNDKHGYAVKDAKILQELC